MSRLALRFGLALVCAILLSGCSDDTDIPPDCENPRVEPDAGNSFGPECRTPAGTVFYISVVMWEQDTSYLLQRCGEPCDTAEGVAYWPPYSHEEGSELSAEGLVEGRYYMWARSLETESLIKPVADSLEDGRLRIEFESGAVIETWFAVPVEQGEVLGVSE